MDCPFMVIICLFLPILHFSVTPFFHEAIHLYSFPDTLSAWLFANNQTCSHSKTLAHIIPSAWRALFPVSKNSFAKCHLLCKAFLTTPLTTLFTLTLPSILALPTFHLFIFHSDYYPLLLCLLLFSLLE